MRLIITICNSVAAESKAPSGSRMSGTASSVPTSFLFPVFFIFRHDTIKKKEGE